MLEILQMVLNDPSFKSQFRHRTKKYSANDKILKQGITHENIYIINTGNVRVIKSTNTTNKKDIHPGIAELGPGDVFGELGLFDDSPANADVISVSESELTEINIASFRIFLENHPEIGYKILLDIFQMLVERLRRADKMIINLYAWGLKVHQIDKHLHEE